MGVRLPAEYQEVDWIECTGGQYLQFGISPSPTDVVELLFAMNNNKPQSTAKNFPLYSAGDGTYQYTTVLTKGVTFLYTYGRYFSNVASNNKGSYDMLSSKTDYVWLRHRSNGNTKAQSCTDVGNNYQFWVEAPQKSSTLDGDNINLRLFARIGSNADFFVGRAKRFIVIRDNAYVLNLISCYRKADSKPGMYDLVTGTFYTNAGTGEFIVGPDVIGKVDRALMLRRRGLMHNVSRYIYEASNLSFNGTSDCINTGVYLFTQENIDRDFEFIAEGIVGNGNIHTGDSTIICAKYDVGALGFLVRPTGSTSLNYKGTIYVKHNTNSTVIVRRINGVITLSGTNITNPTIQFTNAVFNHPLVFGCALQNDGTPYRYCPGTIAHVTVRWL